MAEILKRTTLGMLILLILPVGVMLSGWHWQPVSMGWGYKLLFWFTETVTRPWGTLTSAILCGWFLWCLRFRWKPAVFLMGIIIATLLAGQYTKNVIKQQVQEPRPYVLWLEKTYAINPQQFYLQKRPQRSEMVSTAIAQDTRLPDWLKKHWAFETGFAFPSGPSMFAASWALLGVGLLWPRRRYVKSSGTGNALAARSDFCHIDQLAVYQPRGLAGTAILWATNGAATGAAGDSAAGK